MITAGTTPHTAAAQAPARARRAGPPVPRLQLHRAMKARRVSVQRLARECGLSCSTVTRIREGLQRPSRVTGALIAETLGTTPAALGLDRSEGGEA